MVSVCALKNQSYASPRRPALKTENWSLFWALNFYQEVAFRGHKGASKPTISAMILKLNCKISCFQKVVQSVIVYFLMIVCHI